MRKKMVLIATVAAFFSTALFTAAADLQLFQTLSPGQPPVDVAVSKNGKWIYVLSAELLQPLYGAFIKDGGVHLRKYQVGLLQTVQTLYGDGPLICSAETDHRELLHVQSTVTAHY